VPGYFSIPEEEFRENMSPPESEENLAVLFGEFGKSGGVTPSG
jgi:hypothetical protein